MDEEQIVIGRKAGTAGIKRHSGGTVIKAAGIQTIPVLVILCDAHAFRACILFRIRLTRKYEIVILSRIESAENRKFLCNRLCPQNIILRVIILDQILRLQSPVLKPHKALRHSDEIRINGGGPVIDIVLGVQIAA